MSSSAQASGFSDAPIYLDQRSLAEAFASFTQAAGSLERSYVELQAEVARLRGELRQANADLLQQREAARRLESLAEVSTLLAHEIRNPLGSLELFAGLLAEANLAAEPLAWIHHIQAGLRTLSATVNNVLQLHHGNALQLSPVNLSFILEDCLEFLRPLALVSGIGMHLQTTRNLPSVRADQHCLKQVFLNLALNAFRSMPDGGCLEWNAFLMPEPQPRWIQISIVDHGSGIPPETLDHIFQPGFTTRSGNAGLGLAVCRKIVEQHGGRISVHSVVGQGSTFTVALPVPGETS